jgi:hypothetical protein
VCVHEGKQKRVIVCMSERTWHLSRQCSNEGSAYIRTRTIEHSTSSKDYDQPHGKAQVILWMSASKPDVCQDGGSAAHSTSSRATAARVSLTAGGTSWECTSQGGSAESSLQDRMWCAYQMAEILNKAGGAVRTAAL